MRGSAWKAELKNTARPWTGARRNSDQFFEIALPPNAPWFDWQDGYSAFSVSASQVPAVRRHIENQAEHHRRVSAREELVQLLRLHHVAVDERYLL